MSYQQQQHQYYQQQEQHQQQQQYYQQQQEQQQQQYYEQSQPQNVVVDERAGSQEMSDFSEVVSVATKAFGASAAELGTKLVSDRHPVVVSDVIPALLEILSADRAAIFNDPAIVAAAPYVRIFFPTPDFFDRMCKSTLNPDMCDRSFPAKPMMVQRFVNSTDSVSFPVMVIDPARTVPAKILGVRADVFVPHAQFVEGGKVAGYWQTANDWFIRTRGDDLNDTSSQGGSVSSMSTGSATAFTEAELKLVGPIQRILSVLGFI